MRNGSGGRITAAVALTVGLCAVATPLSAETVSLAPSKDNTLYESATGSLSNGSGQHIFVGRVEVIAGGVVRRAVIAFDIAGGVPAGSTIVSVELRLNMNRTISGLQPTSLHRLLADWGEGDSDDPGEEGGGTAAAPGDATWIHRFFDTEFWTAPGAGGDFAPAASATIQIGGIGTYTFLSTPQMVADVQTWLDDPGGNFGWILIGNEASLGTAKRFDSKDSLTPALRPSLTVEFTTGATPAGRVPDGDPLSGPPLIVEHAPGGDVVLSWGGSCVSSDDDFEIYTGAIGQFGSYVPLTCSTAGATTATFTPSPGSRFYLVVPRNATREGSYGVDGTGVERPSLAGSCVTQLIAACP